MGYSKSTNKLPALMLTLVIHLLLLNFIYHGLLEKNKLESNKNESSQTLSHLVAIVEPKHQDAETSSIKPADNFPTVNIPFHIPDIADRDIIYEDLSSHSFPSDQYKLHNKNSDKYQHLFDPRLREKLQNLKHFTKSKTRSVDGIQILDIGDGMCELTSLSNAPSSSGSGGESAVVKCGNNQSEQMVENMEKTLKDPLGIN